MNEITIYTAATVRPDLPGAAIITRNIISYDEPHGRTSRDSRRKNTGTEDDFGVSHSVAVTKIQNVGKVTVNYGNNIHSNNASTLISTQERNRDKVKESEHQGGMNREPSNKKEDLEDLLQELQAEESGMNIRKSTAKQEPAIRIVHNIKSEQQFQFEQPEDSGHGSPIKRFDQDDNPLDEEDEFNYGFANVKNGAIHIEQNDEPEPEHEDFGYAMLEEEVEQFTSSPPKKANNFDDEEESPKQFALDDLLDDNFEVGKKHDAIQVKPQNHKEPSADDLLADFEW